MGLYPHRIGDKSLKMTKIPRKVPPCKNNFLVTEGSRQIFGNAPCVVSMYLYDDVLMIYLKLTVADAPLVGPIST